MKAGETAGNSNGHMHDSQEVLPNGSSNVCAKDAMQKPAIEVDAQLLQDWPFLDSAGRLPFCKKMLWALPFLGWYAVLFQKRTYMKLFYVDDYPKASLGWIAMFSVLAVLIDAFSDPKMANISDNARFKSWGRRRPFILAGGFATVVVFTFGYWPLVPAGAMASIWFGVFHIATKLCETVALIPLEAWGAELSPYYTDRTSIFMWQQIFVSIGLLLGTAVPGFASQLGGQDCTDGQPGCVGFPLMSFVFGSIFFACLLFLCMRGKERPVSRLPTPNVKTWSEDGVIPTLIMTWLNTPFKYLIVSAAVKAFGANLPFAVLPFMARGLLGSACMKPTRIISVVAAVHIVTRIICLPIWRMVGRRIGKFKSLLAFLACLSIAQSLFVFLDRDTGDCMQLRLATGLASIWGAAIAGIFFLQSIIADVVDYDEFLTGKRMESQYFMIVEFLPKFVEVLSEAIPFLLLAHFGYKRPADDDDAPEPMQPKAVQWTLRLSFSLVPAVFNMMGLICLRNYPKGARTAIAHGKLVLAITEKHRKGLPAEDPWFPGRTMPPPPAPGDQDGLLSHLFPSEILRMIGKHDATVPSFAEVKQAMLCKVAVGAIVAVPGLVLVGAGWKDLDDDLGASVSPLGIILLGVSTLIIWFQMTRYRALQTLERRGPTRGQLIERWNFLCRFTRDEMFCCSSGTNGHAATEPNLKVGNGESEREDLNGTHPKLNSQSQPDSYKPHTPPMPSTPRDTCETSI